MILLNVFLLVIFDVFGIALICALCSNFFEDYEQEETKRIKSATITPKGNAPAKGAGKCDEFDHHISKRLAIDSSIVRSETA